MLDERECICAETTWRLYEQKIRLIYHLKLQWLLIEYQTWTLIPWTYYNLHSKNESFSLLPHPLDNSSHFLYRHVTSWRRAVHPGLRTHLALLFSEREVHPLLPSAPYPAQLIPKALWCVTSHLTLKAVKSQFSDKSNLNLSGDTIFRSDRDRAARVAIILNKHFEANATFV